MLKKANNALGPLYDIYINFIKLNNSSVVYVMSKNFLFFLYHIGINTGKLIHF